MWITLRGVAHALKGEQDRNVRLLLLSMIEQGLCDLATANAPCDSGQFTAIVENLRNLTLDHALTVIGGDPKRAHADWLTTVDEAANLRFSGIRPTGFPGEFGRRKYWVAIPETLAVHHDTLESVIASVRRTAENARTVPSLVLGIRSSGSLLAPLLAAFCTRNGIAPPYATLRPLIDRQKRTDSLDAVVLDAHGRRLVEACQGDIWVVDDPTDSGRTRDAAIAFVARLAPQCTVSFVPIGEPSHALGEYDRQIHIHDPVSPLAPREVHEQHNRTAWHHRERERVYKAYGDHRLAALECRALRAFSPTLDYDAAGQFVSCRFLGQPHRTAPNRAQIVALGESMALYRELFHVEPIPIGVWTEVDRRRGGVSGENGEGDAAEHLVRSNGQLAWWHYRWTGPASVERVSADLGHWSTVVDMGELLASALVELALDDHAFQLLAGVYASSSGDRNVGERISGCLRLYLRGVSEKIERVTPASPDGSVEERHATVRHGLAWLENNSR